MATLLSHALLALAVGALGPAGARTASALGARGLERMVAAVALGAAAAVAEAVVLGLFGLGGSQPALALAAAATWLAARALIPDAEPTARDELVAWLRSAPRSALAGAGAALGLWLAFTAWSLHVPALGFDAVLYHVPEAAGWVENGSPGSIQQIWNDLPVGNYPVALEVLLGWHMALARSLVAVTLVGCAVIGLTGLATWTGLRRLEVPRAAAGVGAAALVAVPTVLTSLSNGWSTDPAALAWVAVSGALCAGALRRPGLLVPAVAAAGLAAGTKTTALALAVALSALTAWSRRDALRELALPLVAVSLIALVVGATWYVRNLVDHGSPLWPYVTTPFGDPQPPVVALADSSFLDRPRATLDRLGGYYLETWGGAILLLTAGLVAPLVTRTRAVLAAAVATGVSLLLWAQAPLTGVALLGGLDAGTGDATRYLLPGLAPAVLAVALAARGGGWRTTAATAVLGAVALIGLVQASGVGEALLPSPWVPLLGAALGTGAGLVCARLAQDRGSLARIALPAGAVIALAVAGALAAPGYLERHVATGRDFESPVLARLAADPRFRDGSEPVAVTFSEIGVLAGDRLRHRLDLIGQRESCAALRARRVRGWVVVPLSRTAPPQRTAIARCLGPPALRDARYAIWFPIGSRPAG
jgi:hypothetical protein